MPLTNVEICHCGFCETCDPNSTSLDPFEYARLEQDREMNIAYQLANMDWGAMFTIFNPQDYPIYSLEDLINTEMQALHAEYPMSYSDSDSDFSSQLDSDSDSDSDSDFASQLDSDSESDYQLSNLEGLANMQNVQDINIPDSVFEYWLESFDPAPEA